MTAWTQHHPLLLMQRAQLGRVQKGKLGLHLTLWEMWSTHTAAAVDRPVSRGSGSCVAAC